MRAYSVILASDFETTSLNRLVYLINYSCTVNKFQSFRIDWSKLLKNSSNSSRRLSLINRMWFLRFTLCLRRAAQIDWLSIGSLSWISFSDVSISYLRLFWKSSWSSEPSGTTGCNRWVEWRHRAQILSESFRQRRMTSSPWVGHFSITIAYYYYYCYICCIYCIEVYVYCLLNFYYSNYWL